VLVTTSRVTSALHLTQTSPSQRTRSSIFCLIVLIFLFVISTYFIFPSGLFFAFIILNGAAQNAAGSYLQTAVVAIASLYGSASVQSMMTGQAAVAVVVSSLQVASAMSSTWGKATTLASDGSAEERAAFTFFTLSTLFYVVSAGAHTWLVKSPSYKAIAGSLELAAKSQLDASTIVSSQAISRGRCGEEDERRQAIRIAKSNILYEIAVMCVFAITLVCISPFVHRQVAHCSLNRPFSPLSPSMSCQ